MLILYLKIINQWILINIISYQHERLDVSVKKRTLCRALSFTYNARRILNCHIRLVFRKLHGIAAPTLWPCNSICYVLETSLFQIVVDSPTVKFSHLLLVERTQSLSGDVLFLTDEYTSRLETGHKRGIRRHLMTANATNSTGIPEKRRLAPFPTKMLCRRDIVFAFLYCSSTRQTMNTTGGRVGRRQEWARWKI